MHPVGVEQPLDRARDNVDAVTYLIPFPVHGDAPQARGAAYQRLRKAQGDVVAAPVVPYVERHRV